MDPHPCQGLAVSRLGDVTWHSARSPCPLQCQKPVVPGILKSEAGISEPLHQRSAKTLRFKIDQHNVEPASRATKTAEGPGSADETQESTPLTTETTEDEGSNRDSDTTLSSSVERENKDEDLIYSAHSSLPSQASFEGRSAGSSPSASNSFKSSWGGSGSDSSDPLMDALKNSRSGSRPGRSTSTGWILDSVRRCYAKVAPSASSDSAGFAGRRLSGGESGSAQPQRAAWPCTCPRGAMMALLGGLLLLIIAAVAVNASQSILRLEDRLLLKRDATPAPMAEDVVVQEIRKPINDGSDTQPGKNVRTGGTKGAEMTSETEWYREVTEEQDETAAENPADSPSESPAESPADGGDEAALVRVKRVVRGLRRDVSPFPSRQKVSPGLNRITNLNESITNSNRMRSDSPKIAR